MLSFGAAQLPTAVLPEDDLTNRGDRFCFVHLSIDALSAFSFPSFACSIAGVASGLPLFFHGAQIYPWTVYRWRFTLTASDDAGKTAELVSGSSHAILDSYPHYY
jgi:hypothetical protein